MDASKRTNCNVQLRDATRRGGSGGDQVTRGSKRLLIQALKSLASPGLGRYIETFYGSTCFFAALQLRPALFGGINRQLTTAYEAMPASRA
jgi:hypothetical protein